MSGKRSSTKWHTQPKRRFFESCDFAWCFVGLALLQLWHEAKTETAEFSKGRALSQAVPSQPKRVAIYGGVPCCSFSFCVVTSVAGGSCWLATAHAERSSSKAFDPPTNSHLTCAAEIAPRTTDMGLASEMSYMMGLMGPSFP